MFPRLDHEPSFLGCTIDHLLFGRFGAIEGQCASQQSKSDATTLIKSATMDENLESVMKYHMRALDQYVDTTKLIASVCVGAVVLLIHELDTLHGAPVRIVLLALATLCYGTAAILFFLTMRMIPQANTQIGVLAQAYVAKADLKPIIEGLTTVGKQHDRMGRIAGAFFVAAIVFSGAFVVAHAYAALK